MNVKIKIKRHSVMNPTSHVDPPDKNITILLKETIA